MRIIVLLKDLCYDDGNALEMALQCKERAEPSCDIEIITLSMGASEKEAMLTESLALGADQAYLLWDNEPESHDDHLTARCLAAAIRKLGRYDLILSGYQSVKGRIEVLGPMVAEFLGIPHTSYIKEFQLEHNNVESVSNVGQWDIVLSCPLPSMLVISRKKFILRGMTLKNIKSLHTKNIMIWPFKDLNHDVAEQWTEKTEILSVFEPVKCRKKIIFEPVECRKHIIMEGAAESGTESESFRHIVNDIKSFIL
jgi:electron transfer flavoprotein alpha/beta subunit